MCTTVAENAKVQAALQAGLIPAAEAVERAEVLVPLEAVAGLEDTQVTAVRVL